MNVYLDDRIFQLQQHGGISQLWRKLTPPLQDRLKEQTWGEGRSDIFLSTYYALPPDGLASVAMVYDCVAERYPRIGRYHPDARAKQVAIRHASAVIAISQWTAADVQSIHDKPAQVAYPGTSIRRADPAQVEQFRQRHGLDRPYVLVVGRRGLYKNVAALYQAWQFFQGFHSHMILCVGGEAPEMADQQFARSFPGQWQQISLPDDEMAAAYTGASMLVYPSLYEGFGLPVLEALACGCPVVCAHDGAVPEFAHDIPHYADVCRPLSIAGAMNIALAPAYERKARGMQLAGTFTWERMAKTIVQILQDMPQ